MFLLVVLAVVALIGSVVVVDLCVDSFVSSSIALFTWNESLLHVTFVPVVTSSGEWLLVVPVEKRPDVSHTGVFETTSAKDLPGVSHVFLGGEALLCTIVAI